MTKAIQACVHCGFCLPACPTYRELGQEMDSPRGRILLMKGVLEGNLDLAAASPYVDRCLGCLACETACPSGVPYRDLIGPFRAQTKEGRRWSAAERVRRLLISRTLPHPSRLRIAARVGNVGKMLGPLVPSFLRPMLNLLPRQLPPKQDWPEIVPAQGKRRARVALLAGCAQQVLDPHINTACIEVLSRNGVEVVVPRLQACCGALAWHEGDLEAARRFARSNLTAFPQDVDAVVTNAAGCGSGLQEYGLIFKGTELEEQAERFSRRSCDISVFLENLGDLTDIPDPGRPLRIAYHDACHLSNAQGVREEPRALLRRIPGVEILEITDAHFCCGSAGTYNIDQPEIASHLGAAKAKNILATSPDFIAAGNIGCLMQIRVHLATQDASPPPLHTICILARAYQRTLAPDWAGHHTRF